MDADAPLVLARWTYYVAATLLFGSSLFQLYAFIDEAPASGDALPRPVTVSLAASALTGAALWLLCFATALAEPQDAGATIRAILLESGFGPAWLVRPSALAVALVAAPAGRPRAGVLASGIALACEGWSGHAAAFGAAGSLLQVAHVLCAAAWIGGLLPLGLLVMRGRQGAATAPVARTAVRRFSRFGLFVVVVLAATG